MAAYALHSQVDGKEITSAARATWLSSFEKRVDPEFVLEPVERARRADAAMRARMSQLSAKAAIARSNRKAERAAAKRRAK
jgi:hypothetical protein